MDFIIDTLFYAVLFWAIFKLGEHTAYARVARGLLVIKQQANQVVETIKGIATIEKIGNQYYAYIGGDFVAQASTIEDVHRLVQEAVSKNPARFVGPIKAQFKDNT